MNTQLMKHNRGVRWWIRTLALLVLVLVVGVLCGGILAKSNLMKRYPAPGQLVDVGGYNMQLYCTGQGSPTVILAAGLDDFSVMWSLVQPEIASTTRVCSYDRAGLGWSEPSPNPPSSGNMVRELHALLVNAEVENPYVLVGHSFGGALVRLYAHNYPNEVAGMVLVDAAPDDLFLRIPKWRDAVDGKLGLYRTLVPLNKLGLLAFAPESIPNRGLPESVLAQYRAVSVATPYYQTGVAENLAFENNLAEIRSEHINLGEMPLSVISRGYWDPLPGVSDMENQHARRMWQDMQSDFLSLSSRSWQIVATESEHSVHLQQPQLVIEAIKQVADIARNQVGPTRK